MTLHLYTPYHEDALAAGTAGYNPGRAARLQMARRWALPALWAAEGDVVLRPDEAENSGAAFACPGVKWVSPADLRHLHPDAVSPWGWDTRTAVWLRRAGIDEQLLPNANRMNALRELSSRRTTIQLLPRLRRLLPDTVGEARWCESEDAVWKAVRDWGAAMLKAPWSCSGRGVFPLTSEADERDRTRLRHLLQKQGAVEAEPIYDRRIDFAMEFLAAGGRVNYRGLSVFRTVRTGEYAGNWIAAEARLQSLLPANVQAMLPRLRQVLCTELAALIGGIYEGPLGVDMMVTADATGGHHLHPCIEVNLRPTMGYAAVAAYERFRPEGLCLLNPDAELPEDICRHVVSAASQSYPTLSLDNNLS